MKQAISRSRWWLLTSVLLMLVSGIGASAVTTGGGSVEVKDLRWETADGHLMSALLFVPETATADTPAPGIVVSHGWWNNREMQDMNFVELSRRGYVVLSMDMYAHGNSDPIAPSGFLDNATGMYAAVSLIADLPYVDRDQIGVSGHSNGARAANLSVAIDNDADEPLISTVVLVDNDPVYVDPDSGEYINMYGDRDVAVIAAQYDEFFFRSYSADGVPLTAPRDYLGTPHAQSFLAGGVAPAEDSPARAADTIYRDGPGLRAIYSMYQTHPWSTTSAAAGARLVDFFAESLPAPAPKPGTDQVWQWKALFNALGLIGFGIFLVSAGTVVARRFSSLQHDALPAAVPMTRGQAGWFYGGLVASTIFSAVSYVWLANTDALAAIAFNLVDIPLKQGAVTFIATWAALNGLFAIVWMAVSHLAYGRRHGFDASGLWPGWRGIGEAVAAALAVTFLAFAALFVVNYVFGTDFRVWVLAIKTFGVDKVWIALTYLPLFALYFVANSVMINEFSRFTIAGREWVNTAVLALVNALGPLILVVWQYVTFFTSGETLPWLFGIYSIWLFPVLVLLPVAAIVGRQLYRATGNPYYGGLLAAAVVTLISVSNTLTVV